jgi:hypothetical protein
MRELTKEEAQSFIRKVMGPPRRRVEGKEHDNLMLMFTLMEPVRESNNQHSWCAEYDLGGKRYDVHYFPNEEPFIEEYLD